MNGDGSADKPQQLDPELLGRKAGDIPYAITRALLSLFGPALAVFEEVFTPPQIERHRQFLEMLAETVNRLSESGLTTEQLKDNEQFLAACVHAQEIWMKTSKEEKRRALQNALRFTGRLEASNDILSVAWSCLDRLTPSHIAVLQYLSKMQRPTRETEPAMAELEGAFPELAEYEMLQAVLDELYQCGLTDSTLALSMTVSYPGRQKQPTILTRFGVEFLRFIGDEYDSPDWASQ